MSAIADGDVTCTCIKCGRSRTMRGSYNGKGTTINGGRALLDWWYLDREQHCASCFEQVNAEIAGGARRTDSETSKAAAIHKLGRRGGQRERMLVAYYAWRDEEDGITDETAYIHADLKAKSSPWRRCTELRDDLGMIEPTGKTRVTSSGCAADCHRITPKGIEALRLRGLVTP